MPTCLASGCPNTTGKTKVKKSYYRVPRPNSDFERERAYRWLLNLQISQKFDFTKDKVVCEDHFHIDSYMSHVHVPPSSQDLRPRKRLLKEGTLPTIFPDCVYDVINMNGTKASGDPRTTLADYFASRNHGMHHNDTMQADLPQLKLISSASMIPPLPTTTGTTPPTTAVTTAAANFISLDKSHVTTTPLSSINITPSPSSGRGGTPIVQVGTVCSLNYSSPSSMVHNNAPSFQFRPSQAQLTDTQPLQTRSSGHFRPSQVQLTDTQPPQTRSQISGQQQAPLTLNLIRPPPTTYNNNSSGSSSTSTLRPNYSTNQIKPQAQRTNQKRPAVVTTIDTRNTRRQGKRTTQPNNDQPLHTPPSCGHLVCRLCVDDWNHSRAACPTCNVHQQKASDTSGDMDNSINDPKLNSQLRRTRIKLLFDDFQSELDDLETRNEEITRENANLKKENAGLKKLLHEQETRYLESLRTSAELERDKREGTEEASDIKTILKLSSKLQEMMTKNENLTQANHTLKKNVKHLRNEKERYLNEIKTLNEENQTNGHQRNRFSTDVLQTKIEGYEREIQQWKKALRRSDSRIEELTTSLENCKNFGLSSDKVIAPSDALHSSFTHQQRTESYGDEIEAGSSRDTNETPNTTTSASEMLLNLANGSTLASFKQRRNTPVVESGDKNVGQMNGTTIDNHNNLSSPPVALKTDTDSIEDPFLDPERFPACRKLMELTKARKDSVESGTLFGQLNLKSSSRNSSRSSESSPRSNDGSPQLPFSTRDAAIPYNGASFNENNDDAQQMYEQQDENGDEITVVIPSNEYTHHSPQETTDDMTSEIDDMTSKEDDVGEQPCFKESPPSKLCAASSVISSVTWTTSVSLSGEEAYDAGGESRHSKLLTSSQNSSENHLYRPAAKKVKTESIY